MSLLLNIDTAMQQGSLCLAREGVPLAFRSNPRQQDHAAWMHVALSELLKEEGLTLSQLDGVAISAGPGSYTGLRVGMSAAKGLCYALKIPLITLNTLTLMASAADAGGAELLCPMIDARRMEVFTAVFDRELKPVLPPTNLILDAGSFHELLEKHRIVFFGNGSDKFRNVVDHPNASFTIVEATAGQMAPLAHEMFKKADFADLAYVEPFYGKDFHSLT